MGSPVFLAADDPQVSAAVQNVPLCGVNAVVTGREAMQLIEQPNVSSGRIGCLAGSLI